MSLGLKVVEPVCELDEDALAQAMKLRGGHIKVLLLFYKSFPTSYSYTKLGRIEAAASLEAAVGAGNTNVTFELDRSPKE